MLQKLYCKILAARQFNFKFTSFFMKRFLNRASALSGEYCKRNKFENLATKKADGACEESNIRDKKYNLMAQRADGCNECSSS